MVKIELTKKEFELLRDVLMSHCDEGPTDEGWKSPELSALNKKIDQIAIKELNK